MKVYDKIASGGLLFLGLVVGFDATAQDFKCRNVEMVVGWGAGGGTDRYMRVVAMHLQEVIGVPVKVINMTGAMSEIAYREVLSRPADGCTLTNMNNEIVMRDASRESDISVFTNIHPIHRGHVDIGMIHAKGGGRFKTWDEMIAWAKANPGKLKMGGTGAGGLDEASVRVPLASVGITDFVYVPYDSGGEMHADLLGGRLDAMYEEVSVIKPMVDAGQVLPLIVLGEKRVALLPNVPAAGELGIDVAPGTYRGVAVKRGTPLEIVDMLSDKLMEASNKPAFKKWESERLLDLVPGGKLAWKEWSREIALEYAQLVKMEKAKQAKK